MGRRCACIREPGSREATWRIPTSVPWTGRPNLPSASAGSRRWSLCARACTRVCALPELFAMNPRRLQGVAGNARPQLTRAVATGCFG